MEINKLVIILVLLLSNVFCQEMDADIWNGNTGKNKWPNTEEFQNILVRLSRKPGPRQYLGLMGKKAFGKTQRARKRHKFQTFVGLMGKRSFEDQGAVFSTED